MAGKRNERPERRQPPPRSIRFTAVQEAELIVASRESDSIDPNVSSLVREIVEAWRRERVRQRESMQPGSKWTGTKLGRRAAS
jgi:hypothetical protein